MGVTSLAGCDEGRWDRKWRCAMTLVTRGKLMQRKVSLLTLTAFGARLASIPFTPTALR